MISKKGFTLFEILIVITIMAIISIAAFTSTTNTQRQFVFINNSKELLMKIREGRLYNVTQKSVELDPGTGEEGVPRAYGVSIRKVDNNIVTTAFADLSTSATNQFDDGSDPTIGPSFSFDSEKYTLTLIDKDQSPLLTFADENQSLTFLYQPGELNVTTFYDNGNGGGPTMLTDPYIHLEFKDANIDTLKKNIIIFTQSGIAEEIQDISVLFP